MNIITDKKTIAVSSEQQRAIKIIEQPLLIIAGPGSGKTFTLTERIANILMTKDITPKNILISTFTEKAAKEIRTRITSKILEHDLKVNINDFYIGTLHSIFLKLIDEYLEYSVFQRSHTVMDDFDQKYYIYRHRYAFFEKIIELADFIKTRSNWGRAEALIGIFNKFTEENIDTALLLATDDEELRAYAKAYDYYYKLMVEENCIDFGLIEKEFYRLITEHPEVLKAIQEKIEYFMIDEYQDTNTLQEMILLKLSAKSQKICVVGDDDQSLYRFRGATVRNILEFKEKFNRCAVVKLETNYRSHKKIIEMYDNYIASKKWEQDGKIFRHKKKILPPEDKTFDDYPSVLKIMAEDEDLWHQEILDFIHHMQESGILKDLNQITFLSNSVKNGRIKALIEFLEENEIPVFSPRADFYFDREEIRLLIGFLLIIFGRYMDAYNRGEVYKNATITGYYIKKCLTSAQNYLKSNPGQELQKFICAQVAIYTQIDKGKTTDDNITSLIYKLIQFEPFASFLTESSLAARNLSMFIDLTVKFEGYYAVSVLSEKKLDSVLKNYFSIFLHYLYQGGISEYEDADVMAPSGAISFMTIHQSKGMEFPITIVTGLHNKPRSQRTELDDKLLPFKQKDDFEPYNMIAEFDYARLYYTAFSRAQNLLVLSDMVRTKGPWPIPSKALEDTIRKLPDWKIKEFLDAKIEIEEVKKAQISHQYSFTSDIALFENCPLQYKFYRDLEFKPARSGTIIFGTLVHQTIEDIHTEAFKTDFNPIMEWRIKEWLSSNYNLLALKENAYLDKGALEAAYKHVLTYYRRNQAKFKDIVAAEVDISVLRKDYVLKGVIDLIQGKDDTVEILDFKATKKPRDLKKGRLEPYQRQLEVYAHIVEERYGKPVSKMHLYYTGEIEDDPKISYVKNQMSIDKTLETFDEVVEKIEKKDYGIEARPLDLCKECDFKHYCARVKPEQNCKSRLF